MYRLYGAKSRATKVELSSSRSLRRDASHSHGVRARIATSTTDVVGKRRERPYFLPVQCHFSVRCVFMSLLSLNHGATYIKRLLACALTSSLSQLFMRRFSNFIWLQLTSNVGALLLCCCCYDIGVSTNISCSLLTDYSNRQYEALHPCLPCRQCRRLHGCPAEVRCKSFRYAPH